MREIHVEVDDAVISAYGWDDISTGHGFHTYRQVERWGPDAAARTELLDRLLLENHARAAEVAVMRGAHDPAAVPVEEGTLFG